jgi:cytochrome c biogenesis protein CcdA/peroxiredoxin
MALLLLFAFVAGIFTVLSPCILPLLPILLAGATAKGRRRPLGIIVGLVVSFTFFTLTLTALVQAIGLKPSFLKMAAIVLVFFFGLVMVFPRLSAWFSSITAKVASLGQRLQGEKPSSGFWSGVIFGVALGLLWTPCAGPILGAIVTLVATRAISSITIFMTLAYSIGAGIPLFCIVYGGNRVISSSHFLSTHSEKLRKLFGVLTMVVAIMLTFHFDMVFEQKFLRYLPRSLVETNPSLERQLKKLRGETKVQGMAPDFVGISEWINSPPLSMKELKGKVVLVDFWTYSCINCIRTLPHLEKWDRDYRDLGLVIVGVHTPEFEFEKDGANVKKAAKELGVNYPIALDNRYETWRAYKNNYWPAHYLIDQEGKIRMTHIGEGGYMETENAIRALLGLEPLTMKESGAVSRPLTPETYLGVLRGRSYAENIKPYTVTNYSYTPPLAKNRVGLKGPWKAMDEYILASGDESYLDLNFLATEVYLVLGGASDQAVEVYLEGKPIKKFKVGAARKYDIVSASYGRHLLSLKVPPGVKAYAFTFGSE